MENSNPYTHRVYGRAKNEKRFRPLDLKNARFVVNLIYASMLSELEATKACEDLNTQNPEMTFQARKI